MTIMIAGWFAAAGAGWLTAEVTERSIASAVIAGLAGAGAYAITTNIIEFVVS